MSFAVGMRPRRPLRLGAVLLAVIVTAALAACEKDQDPNAGGASPSSSDAILESAEPSDSASGKEEDEETEGETEEAATGACKYLDLAEIEAAVGVRFEIVEPAKKDGAEVCVLQTTTGSFPDLTLAYAKTKADADSYNATVKPDGAKDVDKLGSAAFSKVHKAGEGSGPVAEIGWLSKSKKLFSLRYTSAAGTEKGEVEDVVKPLVEVAKDVDEQFTD